MTLCGGVSVGAPEAFPPPPVVVPGLAIEGSCPGAEAISKALGHILPREGTSAADHAGRGGREAVVRDRGASFEVAVGERHREYQDAGRDCSARGEMAALFIGIAWGLVLDVAPPPPPSPPSPPPPPPVDAPPAPAGRVRLLDAGAVTHAAYGWGMLFGAQVGAALGHGGWAVAFQAGAEYGGSITGEGVRLHVLRAPVSLLWRAIRTGQRWGLACEAGLMAALLRAEGVNLVRPATSTGLELGVVAGGRALLRVSDHLALAAGASLAFEPLPPSLEVAPGGAIDAPRVWAGLSFGVEVGLP